MGIHLPSGSRGSSGFALTPRKLIVLVGLLSLFVIPGFIYAPQPAHAVTTTNCTTVNGVPTAVCNQSAGGQSNSFANQRKVFFANGYWWIFWTSTISGQSGVFYQSCPASGPTSCDTSGVWSTPALVTSGSNGANLAGNAFDAYLSGTTLFYVDAPLTNVQYFTWGAINLPATGTIVAGSYVVQDSTYSFAALGQFGWGTDRSSIALDASGNLWISMVTASTNGGASPYKVDVFECVANAASNPSLCTPAGVWSSTTFALASTTANYISTPSLLPVTSGGNYMTLSYVDLATAGTGGFYDIYVAPQGTVSGGAIQWCANVACSSNTGAPAPQQAPASAAGGIGSSYSTGAAGSGAWYSAISSADTVYVVAQVSGVTLVSFAYTVLVGYPAGTYDAWDAVNVAPCISVSGTVAVVSLYTGGAYQFYWQSLANVKSGTNGWTGPTNLALNTEVGVGGGDASPVSYSVGGYSLIGVFWNDNVANPAPATNRMRFAVISMSNAGTVNFPVSLTLSYYQYNSPASTNGAVSSVNYFTISYTVCTQGGCTGPGTAQYTSSTGQPLTITNVQSYSSWSVSDQTSASTNGEKWCLLYGNSCAGAASVYGASDGLTQSWYYYDQLAQANIYAIVTPTLLSVWATPTASVGTGGYDNAQTNALGFTLYPNPNINQPWILPRASIVATGGVSQTVNFVRDRDVIPGCSTQTIYPFTGGGSTCAPSTSFGTLTTVPISANYPSIATLPVGIVEYVPITLVNSQASATSANFQQMVTVDSASFAPYEASTLQNVEFFTASGAIIPSWLESGALSTSTNTVYWLNLGANQIAAGGSLTVYMGFGATTANFFTTPAGNVGEAPMLSPTYGQYDNGAVVFSSYWDFAGSSLPAGWTTSLFSGTTTAGTTNTVLQDSSGGWVVNQWVNDYLQYTSGPASGLVTVISSNTANTITTPAVVPAPDASGDTFVIRSGTGIIINNGVTFTGTTMAMIETTAGTYPDNAITESNYQVPNDLNYGGIMLVTSGTGGPYGYANWQTYGVGAGAADNGFDMDVYNAGNNFHSFAGGVQTAIPASVTPTPSSFIEGGTVNGGDTIEYVNELPSKAAADITTHVPPVGNYYIAAGSLAQQIFSFNWIRQRVYPPSGVMPTVEIGPATIAPAPSAAKVVAYAPITLTNSQTTATPAYFQADVNVTSNSPAMFTGTTTSTTVSPGFTGISSAGSTASTLQDSSATWAGGQWTGYTVEYLTGPAAGETAPILGNTPTSLTTTVPFNPAPDSAGDAFTILSLGTMTDSGAAWAVNAYVGDYLEYTSGPASGQWLQITGNTANTLTTVAPKPAATAGGGDNFVINNGYAKYEASSLQNVVFFVCPGACATTATQVPSWLESGESNNAPTSVYWVNLPSSIAANGGTLTLYIGFVSTGTNLFSSTGYQGETATQGPSYGIYDNGAIVFSFYDNFAGSSLSPQWAPTTTIASGQGAQAALGQLGLATDFPNEGIATTTQFNELNPSYAAFDNSGDLWVVDSGYNRVLEYVPGTVPCAPATFCNGMPASLVLGQQTMGNSGAGTSANTLSNPKALGFDLAGNLWVVDSGNNRIVEYTTPFTTGEAATTVIGQAGLAAGGANGGGSAAQDLSSPRALAFDASGNMWVADSGNSRVIEFTTPFSTDQSASLALGQTNPSTLNGGATTAKGESGPSGVTVAGGNVWVADTGNNRILEYKAPLSNGMAATIELGQGLAPFSGTTTAGTTNVLLQDTTGGWTVNQWVGYYVQYTSGAAVGEASVITANTANTITTAAFAPNSPDASGDNFVIVPYQDGLGNQGGAFPTASTLLWPMGIAVDGSGDVWVADSGNNRVLEYTTPNSDGQAAALVLGQSSFTSTAVSSAANGLNGVRGVTFNGGNLWITDTDNDRVVKVTTPFSSNEAATIVVGQSAFIQTPNALNLYDPTSAAFDSSGNLWVADTGNNRILEYVNNGYQYYSGQSASVVIGQANLGNGKPNFGSNTAGNSGTQLSGPTYIAFDSSGDLWVTDTGNNRILEYVPGTSGCAAGKLCSGMSATLVLGQSGFGASGAATTATGLSNPHEITFDSAGNLWVADTANNRVVMYAKAFSTGEAATIVLGQNSLTNGGANAIPAFSGTDTSATNVLIVDTAANWAVNQFVGSWITFTSGPASGLSEPIVSNTYNTLTVTYAFTTAPTAAGGNTFAIGPSAASLNRPYGIAFNQGDLWVADTGNNRVIEFTPSFVTGESSVISLGQIFLTTANAAASATQVRQPTGIGFDYWGDLWLADTGNNRVIEYQPTYNTLFSGQADNYFEGQAGGAGFYTNQLGTVTGATADNPMGVVFDPLGNLYIADSGNMRVLAEGLGSISVSNGVTIRQTSNWMGIISKATVNPQTSITEFYGYMSSPASQNQAFALNTPGAATPTATPNNLYAFGTHVSGLQNFYDEFNAANPQYNNMALMNLPGTSPQITYTAAYSSGFAGCNGLTPIFYPATTVTCGESIAATQTNSVYWGVKNTTLIMVNAIPGNPNQRWAAAANLLGWTLFNGYAMQAMVPYYLQYGNTFTVQSGGLVPSIAPGITFVVYGTQYGSQYAPLATFSSTTTSQTLYMDAGSIAIMPAAGSGAAAGTRWENSNNQSQTIVIGLTTPYNTVGSCTTLCTATYFEQYEQYLEYTTSDHSLLPITTVPAITYTSFGLTGNLNIPTSTRTIWIDALTNANATAMAPGATTHERWLLPTSKWTITCSNTLVTCTTEIPSPSIVYYHQFQQQITNYKTSDYSTVTSATVPKIQFSVNGTATSLILNFTGSSGATFGISPLASTTGGTTAKILQDTSAAWSANQWVGYTLEYTSGPAAGQAQLILSNTGSSITTAAFNPAPTAGGGDHFIIIYLAWMDAGSSTTLNGALPAIADPSMEQWAPPTNTWTITGSNCNAGLCLPSSPGAGGVLGPFANSSILYDHQFQITYETVPLGLSIESCQYPLTTCTYQAYATGIPVWQTTPLYIVTAGNSTYIASSVGSTAGICLKAPPYTSSCPNTSVSGNQAEGVLGAAGTITGYFNLQEGVTFIQTGIFESPSDQTTWSVTIFNLTDNNQTTGASSSIALSIRLECKSLVPCNYNYQVTSPVYNQFDNARYFVVVGTGSFQLSASVSSTTENINFKVQYKLSVLSDPLFTAQFSGTYTNASGVPASGAISGTSVSIWLTPGSTASVTEAINNLASFGNNGVAAPTWIEWTGTNCAPSVPPPSPQCPNPTVPVSAMSGPVALTANYQVGMTMAVNPPSESAYIGETVTTDVTVFGGVGNVTVGAVVPPGLVGLINIQFWTVQNPANKNNPLTFGSSVEVPDGETVVMEVSVSQHATLYGALNFTVTATSSGYSQIGGTGASAICLVSGVPNCIYTLDIISPKATVIGNAQTPFAITTPGQSSLFYDTTGGGHWLAFYYNGTANAGYLVYASSQNANGTLWNTPEIVPSGPGIQGYAYAVTVDPNTGYVYYVLTSSNNQTAGLHWTYFYYNYGSILSNGSIAWNSPVAIKEQEVAGLGASAAYAAGQPAITIDAASGNVYAAIPTLIKATSASATCPAGALCWRVDLWVTPAAGPLFGWVANKPIASTTPHLISSVNMKLFSLSWMGQGAIALVNWVGNNSSMPFVSVYSSLSPGTLDIQECTPESALTPRWGMYLMYGAQSDIIANGNVIYFAGVNATTNSVVKFYTFTYNGPGGGLGGCGAGAWSTVSQIGVGSPTNKASYWHVTMTWSSGSIIIGYGVDSQLGFAIGTQSGPVWSWFVLPSVQGLSGIQGGLTSAFAPSGVGSGSVGMIWVQKISSSRYAVEFALA